MNCGSYFGDNPSKLSSTDRGVTTGELNLNILEVQKEFGTFSNYMWSFVNGKVIDGKRKTLKDIPAITKEAEVFSKDLKKRGFKFLGPTVVYAHMQAVGMVNDHVKTCFRYKELKAELKALKP